VLVVPLGLLALAAGVELDSLVDDDDDDEDDDEEDDASAPDAAGVSVLGLDDPPLEPDRLSVL
jgi:hypothetical protein